MWRVSELFELQKVEDIKDLVSITKSNSGISGPVLAETHMKLGRLLSKHIPLNPDETTVVAIMRGGLFLAEGIYLESGCKFETYNPKTQEFIRPKTKHDIIVDSVINTGDTIKKIVDEDMSVACCVINEKAVEQFSKKLYVVRVSANSFIGANVSRQDKGVGPDTTMRLFNQL